MRLIELIIDGVSRFLVGVSSVLVAAMMAHVTVDVLCRFILGFPLVGTLEAVAYYYMVAAVFIGLPIVTRERGHIHVELFTQWMSPRAQGYLNGTVMLLTSGFLGLLTYASIVVAVRQTMFGEVGSADAFPIPIWPSRWLVVFGFGLTAFYFFIQSIEDIVFARTGVSVRAGEEAKTGSSETNADDERDVS